jgi:hypothetical protein
MEANRVGHAVCSSSLTSSLLSGNPVAVVAGAKRLDATVQALSISRIAVRLIHDLKHRVGMTH